MSLDQLAEWERQDLGVAPSDALRSGNLHGPTPASIPGGQVITTKGLIALVEQRLGPVFDVLGGTQTLPGAIQLQAAGQQGNFQDETQGRLGNYLRSVTKGRQDIPLVFFCSGRECWMSYNAALRAIQLGYRNVLWYRGGLEAWHRAGRPLAPSGGNPQPVPAPEAGETPSPAGGPGARAAVVPAAAQSRMSELSPMAGVTVRAPQGWRATAGGNGAVEMGGPEGERLVIWPVFQPANHPGQSGGQPQPHMVVSTLARKLAPGVNWGAPSRLGASAVRVHGRSASQVGQATYAYRASTAGVAGFVFLTAARPERYDAAGPAFAEILRSYKVVGGPSSRSRRIVR